MFGSPALHQEVLNCTVKWTNLFRADLMLCCVMLCYEYIKLWFYVFKWLNLLLLVSSVSHTKVAVPEETIQTNHLEMLLIAVRCDLPFSFAKMWWIVILSHSHQCRSPAHLDSSAFLWILIETDDLITAARAFFPSLFIPSRLLRDLGAEQHRSVSQ